MRYVWVRMQPPLVTGGGCLEKVWGKEDEQRVKTHSVHSPASGNAWLDDNSGEGNCFSVVILEVTHVFVVSRIGVPLFCCSLWFHSLSYQEITLWCCCLSTRDMLCSIKQTSKVMTRNRPFPTLQFNIEILAKLAVHTHTHRNKSLKSLRSFKCWNFPCDHLWRDQSKGCSATDLLYNHAQVV